MYTDAIPTADELTPAWFTDLLRSAGDLPTGTAVTDVTLTPFGEGESMMSALHRASLTYDGPTDAPRTLIVKLASANEGQRFIAGMFRFYEREIRFYHELREQVSVATPRCYRAAIHPDEPRFVLVLEEVQGRRAVDQLEGVDLADAMTVVTALADLHAPFWAADLSSLATTFVPLNAPAMHEIIPAKFGADWAQARERVADDLPAEVVALCDRYAAISSRMLDDLMGPDTLAHADCRADNLLFGTDDVLVLDFQLAAVCNGVADVSYFVGQSVRDDVAAAHADELLAAYIARLAAAGISVDPADARRVYRAALLFFLTIPVSLLVGTDLPERSERLARSMLRRAAAEIVRTGAHEHYR